MKRLAYLVLMLLPPLAYAHDEDIPINDTSELLKWCKTETEDYYLAKGITPYNWTASWREEGNTLLVKGRVRVESEDVSIECRISTGAKKQYMVFEIKNEGLISHPFSAYAHDEDIPVNNASELLEWCKAETENYFVTKGMTPSNWSASWREQGNTLLVNGRWRIELEDVPVVCHIVRGAKRKYAVYEIKNK